MFKYGILGALLAMVICAVGVAQEDESSEPAKLSETAERILIDDPEPVETEYFLAEGAAPSEIVDDENLMADSTALAALADDADGDMAAMPEVLEE